MDSRRAMFPSFNATEVVTQKSELYLDSLKECMFGLTPTKLMDFHPPKPQHDSTMTTENTPVKTPRRFRKETRDRPRDPRRVLDAPGLIDDFYLNLLAWSNDNMVAVALGNAVYLGNMTIDVVSCLCKIHENHYVSSLEWIGTQFLAVGVSYGKIKIFDITTKICVRNFLCHLKRVSSLNWSETNFLASGGRDGKMMQHDLRLRIPVISQVQAHSHEACQVSWSLDGNMLASGGNDDVVHIWDVSKWESPRYTFTDHTAAVKAIAWNPHDHSMIVTGGGSADSSIKFWNARVGIVKKSVNTSAQVCSLVWNPHQQELLSGHGYGGNKLCLWSFPSVACIQEFPLRADVRPLNMSLCPEGSQVCVANSDETLKFWAMFTPLNKKNADELTLPESYAKSFGDALPMSDTFWESHQVR
jgi:cell division cycle protein 20 (cofactor of APC complex)